MARKPLCETNTPAVLELIRQRFREENPYFIAEDMGDDFVFLFEHGMWFVEAKGTDEVWAVHDAMGSVEFIILTDGEFDGPQA